MEATEKRRMLEFAAKAAGITISTWSNCQAGGFLKGGNGKFWNPLDDDGDALRLAVMIAERHGFHQIAFNETSRGIRVFADKFEGFSKDKSDTLAATRLAIVRAAAAIGEAMP